MPNALTPEHESNEVELPRSLGLTEAMTISLGTMIGAGIFVLPGLVIGKAGPGAVLAFALGGVVAYLVAMSAAEVATGMPKSGGGYYFVSRALGPLWGALIGSAAWFALIFASAFYMVGFGEYAATVIDLAPRTMALVMTCALVLLNLVGSEAVGRVQNAIVLVLLLVLTVFLIGTGRHADPTMLSGSLLPNGFGGVLVGTAILFVSYCGCAEITSVGEEIRDPGITIPRAMRWSVLSVTLLYCLTVLACLACRPWEELASPTVVADLAELTMGATGRGVVLLGAALATISSANASIMAASRISFAMGRDHLVADWVNQVHPRWQVPHRAIALTGALTLGTIGLGGLELLAEAAGALHLLLYGLICVACVILRGARDPAYQPVYLTPLFPVVPILGALGCLVVMSVMPPPILLVAGGVLLLGGLHYLVWGRQRTKLVGLWPYFLRRAVLEPSLVQVEAWGAEPDELPNALVAVAHPEREVPRLTVVGALMGARHGEVLVVHVFTVHSDRAGSPELLEDYRQAVTRRAQALARTSASIERAGARVRSYVPLSTSVLFGIVNAAEAAQASLAVLGWPEPGPQQTNKALEMVVALDVHLTAHLLVARELGPVPATTIHLVFEGGPHASLALLTAIRLTNAWQAKLTVSVLLAPETSDDQASAAVAAAEATLGDRARATVTATRSASLCDAVRAAAEEADMVVFGLPDREGALPELLVELLDVSSCSLLLARAEPSRLLSSLGPEG
jgi:amino acid transporter